MRRFLFAAVVFALAASAVIAQDSPLEFVVRSTADAGEGSLRAAIGAANEACGPDGPLCVIRFDFTAPAAPGGWQTIRPLSPLPAIGSAVTIEGTTAADTNPLGPDVELDGGNAIATGLLVTGCDARITGLAIHGFTAWGIEVRNSSHEVCFGGMERAPSITANFIGVDPTGGSAHGNERGIGVLLSERTAVVIRENVIGGNVRSGIWLQGGSNHIIEANRIGVGAHDSRPLPNRASGIFVAPHTGTTDIHDNVIAHNGEWGISLHPTADRISIRRNAIHSNFALGIDWNLDFVTPNSPKDRLQYIYGRAIPNTPTLTSARFDAATGRTTIEGTVDEATAPSVDFGYLVELFASAAADASGFGEGAVFVGDLLTVGGHFTVTLDADLRGQIVTATSTAREAIGFAKPASFRSGFWEKTSEFGNAIPVH